MRSALTLALLIAVPAVAVTADVKPDFTLTAEEYAKESVTDSKAFGKKYQGKTVELTGTVWNMRLWADDVLLNGYWKDAPKGLPTLVSATPPKLEGPLLSLSQGQQVTVRGKQKDPRYPILTECEFVKIGPSTAIPVALAGLVAEFKKDGDAASKKYAKKSVVMRVKLVDAKVDIAKSEAKLTVTDPAKDEAKVTASCDTLVGGKMLAEMQKLKPGETVILMGEADQYGEPIRFYNVFLLKEPPAGVKLPGDKK